MPSQASDQRVRAGVARARARIEKSESKADDCEGFFGVLAQVLLGVAELAVDLIEDELLQASDVDADAE